MPIPAITGRMSWDQGVHCTIKSGIREGLEIFQPKIGKNWYKTTRKQGSEIGW